MEMSRAEKWRVDEAGVRDGTCSFYVKYLGAVEVFESRGMQVVVVVVVVTVVAVVAVVVFGNVKLFMTGCPYNYICLSF